MNDLELHLRGLRTAYAAWTVHAAGAAGAAVRAGSGWTAAVFPSGPEAEFLNNAVLDRDLSPASLASAVDEVERGYAAIGSYAVWITDDDPAARTHLEAGGYAFDSSTASMAVELTRPLPPLPHDAGPVDWSTYVGYEGGLLAGTDPHAFRVVTALVDGEVVAAAIAFEHDGDLGIYNVGTHEHARRRGLATALTTALLNDAFERGCTTATLQATPMAERVYAACGFRTVARILEFVPAAGQAAEA